VVVEPATGATDTRMTTAKRQTLADFMYFVPRHVTSFSYTVQEGLVTVFHTSLDGFSFRLGQWPGHKVNIGVIMCFKLFKVDAQLLIIEFLGIKHHVIDSY
jgi:hypothetical protein